jgi:bifunctional DNA-binding transcriptional regulator/antitoxin component of YhaV-PrlF toxin-antitoxin module
VSVSGRISLPVSLRKKYGLLKGGEVVVTDTGASIVLQTLEQAIAHAQSQASAIAQGKHGASVEAFILDRRTEAEKE